MLNCHSRHTNVADLWVLWRSVSLGCESGEMSTAKLVSASRIQRKRRESVQLLHLADVDLLYTKKGSVNGFLCSKWMVTGGVTFGGLISAVVGADGHRKKAGCCAQTG